MEESLTARLEHFIYNTTVFDIASFEPDSTHCSDQAWLQSCRLDLHRLFHLLWEASNPRLACIESVYLYSTLSWEVFYRVVIERRTAVGIRIKHMNVSARCSSLSSPMGDLTLDGFLSKLAKVQRVSEEGEKRDGTRVKTLYVSSFWVMEEEAKHGIADLVLNGLDYCSEELTLPAFRREEWLVEILSVSEQILLAPYQLQPVSGTFRACSSHPTHVL